MLGSLVSRGPEFSPGQEELMWKLLQNKSLNTLTPLEVRFLHLVLTRMYDLCLNLYLLRDGIANAGTRDNIILGRKVPVEIWKLIYDGCVAIGVTHDMLLDPQKRAALWIHLNARPELLQGLARYVIHRTGVTHSVRISPQNIIDGNFLYNLGGSLPSRLLTVIGYCLLNWGRDATEPWVRLFVTKIFIFYLTLAGHVIPREATLARAVEANYSGIMDVIAHDMLATRGKQRETTELYVHPSLDYLFVFANDTALFTPRP
ncbi:protein UL79 [Common bottlenose dolphin gammaherpesvirus 1 strain Sarasota]|uniref:Protein UL79 n=1 Tax=Common bottlenose dolphin gammaherpesvirus 1 strain Sarasota TaxID=2022783 RepID=A0A1Z1NE73_9GAMA|nr:protein UL79 [Common bottlenose dolphin gammaherpesvirus 1 strain Sarasota]ARW78081.1 protein UL79 [Common bottlenose dolphin gammaherpesvirus 1 strain Sarasota]